MSNSLNLTNFNRKNVLAQTKLTADAAATVTSLPVGNSSGFSDGGYIILGGLGNATAELLVVGGSGGTATTIPTIPPTMLAHNFDDPVTLLFGNQINVYRADDVAGNGSQPPDANFAKIDTITIVPNNALTPYTDADGTTGQWYKFTYFNPTTQLETLLADSNAVQTGRVHYVSLDQVRDAAGFSRNPNVTDDIVQEKRDAAEREVDGALQGVYDLPLPQPTNPIIVTIVKNIAGGELMAEMYTGMSMAKVNEGNAKAAKGRVGSDQDNVAGLAQLVDRSVILLDANYIEESRDDAHGFSGYPDETTERLPKSAGGDDGFHFTVNKVY